MARCIHIAERGLTLVAFSGIFLVAQSIRFLYVARHIDGATAARLPATLTDQTASARPPVVWIILDELSEDQVFEHRFAGLALPAFDRLAGQSTSFSHAIPTNLYTESAVPALMTGLPVRAISSSADGQRLTLELKPGGRQLFDQQQTIFADAHRLGYSTAVAGWYNPYCRILADVLNRCARVPHHDKLPGGFTTDASFGRNLAAPLLASTRFVGRLFAPDSPLWVDRALRDDHIDEYRQLDQDALSALADPETGFLLLHVAAPHPEGIYNRRTRAFTDDGRSSYVDNLALADTFLQQVQDTMTRLNQWDEATVVVMGDHAWRTRQMWRPLPSWTAEDESASRAGVNDDRPAYLVKLPNQHTAAQVDEPFDTLRTRALFDRILTHTIQTPDQLADWASHS